MKNKINLLLTLSLPLFILNCSTKPVAGSTPTQVQVPPTTTVQQAPRPSLGRPISETISTTLPSPRSETLQQSIPSTPAPIVRPTPKYGQSHFSKRFKLPNSIKETSGLIKLDNRLWTFNDSGGKAALYQINERNGDIVKSISIQNAKNKDWEDIAYDDNYVYIADVGNNKGNRKDLKIYKIPRAALRTEKSVKAEVINFNYSDQKNFTSRPQKHNYDCEAITVNNGKIYLFSKNWQDNKTRLYELSTQVGKHTAKHISTFNIQGMVTAASINKELDILLLTTYSSLLNVNVWAFSNYRANDFFSGNRKRLNFKNALQGQVEGITFIDNYKAYMSSEAFSKYIFSFDPTLYELDFSGEFE
ncbi:MAG: Unknown protein [uncultured Sulfurovum sp.]|uniref:Uncharacterized protein n=1 Tax=uncultured Sulfurovum sp. TaxID=269237 RepID=A0A6S6RX30_9BACT|nr:MAG: Unknown protein [uncultured Sulfurovum sp.]